LVTLGRFDVHYAAQTMARYNMAPREGHLQAMKRIFGYLKNHAKLQIVYNAELPEHTEYSGANYDWFELYPSASEEIPDDLPVPKGKPVKVSGYFDADHAGCLQTRRSTTGILMFLNRTPVKWYSKRQATVESSTYGSEMVAGRFAVEFCIEMRYKLRALGVPIVGSCLLFGDNKSMVLNTTVPSSMLKKKHNAIAYHRVREAVAAAVVEIIHVDSKENLADILTKPLGPQVFHRLLAKVGDFPTVEMFEESNEGELWEMTYSEDDVTKSSEKMRMTSRKVTKK
jgi:hypothetical protein